MKLAKAGYGTPMEILDWPSDMVLHTFHYEDFTHDLEESFQELNKEEK